MQYIECIHCRKRFPANRKFKDAMGKKVRCSECGKSFPIIVYDAKRQENHAADRPVKGDS